MKILFDHPNPFLLAHGGFQAQIEQTKKGLETEGLEVEWLRWWDANQTGDIIHYFGRPTAAYIQAAHAKGLKFVMAELLTGLGSRSRPQRLIQKALVQAAQRFLPKDFSARLGWEAYREADACVALTEWERKLMISTFRARHVHVVPNGVEEIFLCSEPVKREDSLVCTATITPRKNVLKLAQAAVQAQTPLWIIGEPYTVEDSYFKNFLEFTRCHAEILRYEGGIRDRRQMAQAYRKARGFVLLSTMESLSLSALEATACECPLMLSNLPWARTTFGDNATYCSASSSTVEIARALRSFYDSAPTSPLPEKPKTWRGIARDLHGIYGLVCKTSR